MVEGRRDGIRAVDEDYDEEDCGQFLMTLWLLIKMMMVCEGRASGHALCHTSRSDVFLT